MLIQNKTRDGERKKKRELTCTAAMAINFSGIPLSLRKSWHASVQDLRQMRHSSPTSCSTRAMLFIASSFGTAIDRYRDDDRLTHGTHNTW